MKLLVLGASGACGRHVVRQALKRGHDVTSVVRMGTDYIPKKKENIIRGSVLNEDLIRRAVHNTDGIISCLGQKRKSKLNPWSEITSPTNLVSTVSRHLVKHAKAGTKVVVVSAGGVGESFDQTNWLIRFLINTSSLGPAYDDLEQMENNLSESKLDWLSVRPVTLNDGPLSDKTHRTEHYDAVNMISRANVANWMLNAIEKKGPFSRRIEMITD